MDVKKLKDPSSYICTYKRRGLLVVIKLVLMIVGKPTVYLFCYVYTLIVNTNY